MSRKRIGLVKHLSLEELENGYRSSKDAIERSHWQMVWLYGRYGNADKVAEQVGYSAIWVREIVKRYNRLGVKGLKDLRHENPGQERVLSQAQEESLVKTLEKDAPGLGLWTGPKVATWITQKTKQKVSSVTGWQYLRRLGYSLQVPRPQHRKAATQEEQASFKKTPGKTKRIVATVSP
jgi:transposase